MSGPIKRLAAEEAWREAFAGFAAGPAWYRPLREAAFARFAETGLPTPRTEDWRWSDIHRHLGAPYPPATAAAGGGADIDALLAADVVSAKAETRLVFVDGALDSARSRIAARDGLEVDTLAAVPRAPEWADPAAGEDAIDLLNAAFATDGALIRVRAGVDAGTVAIVSIGTGEGVSHALRHVLRLEEGATLNLLETQLGGGDNVTTTVCRVRLDDDATLRRVQAELKDDAAIHFANLHAELGARARLADLTLIRGGRFHRQQDFVDLAGPQAEAQVDSAYLLRGRQHADTHLVVNHLVPHGTSRETFKCVMDERARGAFQGRIHVAPGAQKSDGRMAAHGLLLGEAAEFDAKPELEIYADDVVCAHGATAGALDEEQMFYLRARGVPEREARALLIAAFVAETFDAVEDEEVRAALRSLARAWLAGEE